MIASHTFGADMNSPCYGSATGFVQKKARSSNCQITMNFCMPPMQLFIGCTLVIKFPDIYLYPEVVRMANKADLVEGTRNNLKTGSYPILQVSPQAQFCRSLH
ncbi:hypothetical protein Pyn_02806 [Prunus yedoensis var. nudiflora]|uniref:Uncharacterized protein n=1 Tax=Prunus yedoensis var. nudiflora TaxID=2094558 RepID=A0A314UKS8_PRUYE|nr:hypothetical protein Pyn_36366 [Prunus yedoensis var. nudiflora]PQM40705.1 hypothetical protein Pyn_02806 [Prunus yedoensis var. nudiflora]